MRRVTTWPNSLAQLLGPSPVSHPLPQPNPKKDFYSANSSNTGESPSSFQPGSPLICHSPSHLVFLVPSSLKSNYEVFYPQLSSLLLRQALNISQTPKLGMPYIKPARIPFSNPPLCLPQKGVVRFRVVGVGFSGPGPNYFPGGSGRTEGRTGKRVRWVRGSAGSWVSEAEGQYFGKRFGCETDV
ncbi:hypothetical protein Salat_2439700 [Sesamum alatum]|uniref:Uncharacterized protein n=1 Tax=Sesamum alatum TaxID=300844 RepID=A0AAE1XY51_9LAMI|nr:hypothetical protein Salat_2439700 [Sesamum alatum]